MWGKIMLIDLCVIIKIVFEVSNCDDGNGKGST